VPQYVYGSIINVHRKFNWLSRFHSREFLDRLRVTEFRLLIGPRQYSQFKQVVLFSCLADFILELPYHKQLSLLMLVTMFTSSLALKEAVPWLSRLVGAIWLRCPGFTVTLGQDYFKHFGLSLLISSHQYLILKTAYPLIALIDARIIHSSWTQYNISDWRRRLKQTAVGPKVSAQSKACVCGRLPVWIAGSNPTGDMDVCVLWFLCCRV
jgi:hypothetical protein